MHEDHGFAMNMRYSLLLSSTLLVLPIATEVAAASFDVTSSAGDAGTALGLVGNSRRAVERLRADFPVQVEQRCEVISVPMERLQRQQQIETCHLAAEDGLVLGGQRLAEIRHHFVDGMLVRVDVLWQDVLVQDVPTMSGVHDDEKASSDALPVVTSAPLLVPSEARDAQDSKLVHFLSERYGEPTKVAIVADTDPDAMVASKFKASGEAPEAGVAAGVAAGTGDTVIEWHRDDELLHFCREPAGPILTILDHYVTETIPALASPHIPTGKGEQN